MTQLVCWVLFPVVLGLVSLGCGLLVESAAGMTLPEPLVLPVGLALVIDASELTTKLGPTAKFTTPLVLVLAVLGLVLRRPWRQRPRLGLWSLGAAVAVYAVFLAPVFLTGEPTFTGYIKLDDTATWMAMAAGALSHGHDLAGLAASSYETTLHFYLNGGEPVGALLPWGVGHQLVGEDLAWVFQPYLAFLGAMLALSVWPIARSLIRSRALAALAVFVVAQSALVYGYSLWGGIKEIAAAATLPLLAACAVVAFDRRARLRGVVPLLVATFAMLSILAYSGDVWLAVVLTVAALLTVWTQARSKIGWLERAATALGWVVLAVVLVIGGHRFQSANGALTSNQLGNLLYPLQWRQIFGIWPTGDFRYSTPQLRGLTDALIVIVIVAGVLALVLAWRRRGWALWLYAGAGVVGALLVNWKGSPWVGAKAIATASPALLLAGLIGAVALLERCEPLPWEMGTNVMVLQWGRRAIAGLGALAVGFGVLWSNVLAYHHVTIAPYRQFAELAQIGQRFAGDGPTLINEYQPYAARYFLRNMDPESPSELRRRQIPLLGGALLPKGGYADLDELELAGITVYRTIVLRTSPTASRPPAYYRLVFDGRWYQVWQRPQTVPRTWVSHLGLGNSIDPAAVPACGQVLGLARRVGPGGLLAAVPRPSPTAQVVPSPLPGTTSSAFVVTAPGRYQLWLGGSFWRRLTAYVDGVRIGSIRGQLNEAGDYTPLGALRLGVAAHRVTLSYGDAELDPGGGGPGPAGPSFPVGPLVLAPADQNLSITFVAPGAARSLCGRRWDWVEALGG